MSENIKKTVEEGEGVPCPHENCGVRIFPGFVRLNGYCPACSGKLECRADGQVAIPVVAETLT